MLKLITVLFFLIPFLCQSIYSQELKITSYAKIGASHILLNGLEGNDNFGTSLEVIGDLDHNGIPELAMAASGDDDGGTNKGSVYIFFRDNTLKFINVQKISATSGNFTGILRNNCRFGSGLGLEPPILCAHSEYVTSFTFFLLTELPDFFSQRYSSKHRMLMNFFYNKYR